MLGGMTRLGAIISAVIVLAVIGFASMLSFGPAPATPKQASVSRDVSAVASALAANDELRVPVAGVPRSAIRDSWGEAREGGARGHHGTDIMARAGTPVIAAADGWIEKLFDSERGGLTIYQFEPSGRWCYYYAHLQRYADGLAEKQVIKRGDVIGYVGSTGNASADAPHLHFEVHMLGPEKQWWKGESINPYPLLKSAALTPGAASASTPE